MGVGAFTSGIFHVMTHAFFKALLFLGAGSVIHSMHEEQDIQHFGGLKKYMPQTYFTFLIAAMAISGIPPLSGFFSKDDILWNTFANGHIILWFIGTATALLTAFYMFRLYFLTFEGKERFGHNKHPHESPKLMTIPLIVLAFLSAIGGFIGIPAVFSGDYGNLFERWLEPVFKSANSRLLIYGTHSNLEEIVLMSVTVIGAAFAIFFARYVYLKNPRFALNTSQKFKGFYNLLLNKYFVDELYNAVVVNPIARGSDKFLWRFTDITVIDGIVNGTASIINYISGKIRKIQTGVTQFYAVVMMLGIIIALFWIIMSL
jgi:NADH-quinone oxidoreductase subunit L